MGRRFDFNEEDKKGSFFAEKASTLVEEKMSRRWQNVCFATEKKCYIIAKTQEKYALSLLYRGFLDYF